MGKKKVSSKPAFSVDLMDKKQAKKYGKLEAEMMFLEGKWPW